MSEAKKQFVQSLAAHKFENLLAEAAILKSFLCRHFLAATVLISSLNASHTMAAQFEPAGEQFPVGRAPEGLRADLQLGDGSRTTYHIGELIPVRILISSTEHTKIYISYEPCRDQEVYPDTVPAGLLKSRGGEQGAALSFSICSGHGWGGNIDLATTPYKTELLLNDAYLLDTPGNYPLIWTASPFKSKNLLSNSLTLTLLPHDTVWESAELARIDALLNLPSGKQENACIRLRYLGTPAAELDMAKRLGTNRLGISWVCDNELGVALINAKQREAVLNILETRLVSPEEAIPESYLRILALISLYHQHPEWYTAAQVGAKNVAYTERIGPLWNQSLVRDEELRYASLLSAALPTKTPEARAQCIEAILQLPKYGNTGPLPATIDNALQSQIPLVFNSLNGLDQQAVLGPLWNDLASPAMIPLLQNVFEHDGDPKTRGLALLRLQELAPDRAQEEFAQEIAKPNIRLNQDILAAFPGHEVSALDPVLLQRATEELARNNSPGPHSYGNDIPVLLLSRFASAAVEPQVRALLGGSAGKLTCGESVDLLAFVHRVDPPSADRLLLGQQPKTVCPIHAVAQHFWSPAVQSLELAELDSSRPEEVSDALLDLQHNASAMARPVMLQHFQLLNKQWKAISATNTTDSLRRLPGSQLDSQYLHSLLFAFGWRNTPAEIQQFGQLCLNESCVNEAKQRSLSYQNEDTFIVLGSGSEEGLRYNYGFAPYGDIGDLPRMLQKFSQYPYGTAFSFDGRQHSARVIQHVKDTLGAWLTANGYSFTVYSEK